MRRTRSVPAEGFEPGVVDGVAFENLVAQHGVGPDAKLCGAFGINPIPDGDDGVEVVILWWCMPEFRPDPYVPKWNMCSTFPALSS